MKASITIIIFILFISCDVCEEQRRLVKTKKIHTSFDGVIKEKYLNPKDKMMPYVVFKNGSEQKIFNELYDSFKIGDRLIKEKGRIDYMWIKDNNDTVIFYWQCKHKDIK